MSDAVLEFWRLFRAACPQGRVECRGTDFTVGMNLVNHATPYARLYAGDFNITPPPNTPWPALTRNHGLALTGYLSQISAFRGASFPFRYYAMDPWFCNNPWLDRWERNPHDIYLFHEYHRYTFDEPDRIAEPMAGDLLIVQALNGGLPLTGVTTTEALVAGLGCAPERYAGRVLVSPVPDPGSAWEAALADHLDAGGSVLCYGPADRASRAWLGRLGVRLDTPLDGTLDLRVAEPHDRHAESEAAAICHHHPALSAGGIREAAARRGACRVLASVERSGAERVAASVRGRLAWVRGTSSVTVAGVRGRSLETHDPVAVFPCETLFRVALAACSGWNVAVTRGRPSRSATHLSLSRCRNGFVCAGFSPDDTAAFEIFTPFGAPLLPGRNTALVAGRARVPVNRWFHETVRLFVEQESGTVGVHAHPPANHRFNTCLKVDGLKAATVRFFPQTGTEERLQILLNPDLWILAKGDPFDVETGSSPHGDYIELPRITGTLILAWWDTLAHA